MSIAWELRRSFMAGQASFSDELAPQGLHLLEARPLSTGCVILRWACSPSDLPAAAEGLRSIS
jgi:hypothetical protein